VQIVLIRHPRPRIAAGVCYGASDVPLAEPAIRVATRLRPLLDAEAPIFSSPLRRCHELATCLAAHFPAGPVIDARLAEIDFGEWEMQSWDAIGGAALDAWAAAPIDYRPPGGESPRAALTRALEFIETIQGSGLPAATLITHGGIMRLLAGHWQGLPETRWLDLRFAFGRATGFRLDGDGRGQLLFLDS
jgi:alpha-ribazole phosphatase